MIVYNRLKVVVVVWAVEGQETRGTSAGCNDRKSSLEAEAKLHVQSTQMKIGTYCSPSGHKIACVNSNLVPVFSSSGAASLHSFASVLSFWNSLIENVALASSLNLAIPARV